MPLFKQRRAHVMVVQRLNGDGDPVLANGKTNIARAWFIYAMIGHSAAHIRKLISRDNTSVLQADAYGHYGKLNDAGCEHHVEARWLTAPPA